MSKAIKQLKEIQADTYLLLLKTHNFHWNVSGPNFQSLHSLFESQYNELFSAVDVLSERIRALNHRAPGSFEEFSANSKIKSSKSESWKDMLIELIEDNSLLVKNAKKLVKLSEEAGDDATADIAISRIQIHEKNIWILSAHLR